MSDEKKDLLSEPRFEWISQRICDSLRIKDHVISKTVSDSENRDSIIKFFTKHEVNLLFVAYPKNSSQLRFSLNPIPTDKKSLVFFKNESRDINNDNVSEIVHYEELFEDPLLYISTLMKEVFLPLVQNKKNQRRWPSMMRKDILNQFHSIIGTLSLFTGRTKGNTILPVPPIDDGLKKENAEEDRSLIHNLESVITEWSREIKKVIENDSEKVLNSLESTGNYPGPNNEIDFWKMKAANLKNLDEQLSSEKVSTVIKILEKNQSSYLEPFKKTLLQLQEAREEAQEIYRFLLPLQQHFENLSAPFEEVHELISSYRPILHILSLIWSESKYFSTVNIIVLIRQICNEINKNVCGFVDVETLWEIPLEKTIEKLKDGSEACESFKKLYFEYKEKVNGKHPDRQWRFENSAIFFRLDAFNEKLQDLLDIAYHILDFSQLEKVEIGGIKGEMMSVMVRQIYEDFQKEQQQIQSLKFNLLDANNHDFDKAYFNFKVAIKDFDKRLCFLITKGFNYASTTANAFKLLESFASQMNRDAIRKEIEGKYVLLLKKYSAELTAVYRIFMKHKDNPPILPSLPRVSGALQWANGLIERIAWPMKALKQLDKNLLESNEMKQVIKKYNYLIEKLKEYQGGFQQAWVRDIQQSTQEKLSMNLLKRLPDNRLIVNIDKSLLSSMLEVKYLKSYQTEIPSFVSKLFDDRENFRQYIARLETMVRQYNTIITTVIDVEKPLIINRLTKIDENLEIGIKELRWSTDMNMIAEFIKQIMALVKDLYDRLNYLKGNVKTIEKMIASWINLSKVITTCHMDQQTEEEHGVNKLIQMIAFWRNELAPTGDKPFGMNLAHKIFLQWKSKTDTTVKKPNDIVEQGSKIHFIVRRSKEKMGASSSSESWIQYVTYLNDLVGKGLYQAIKNSLQFLIKCFEPINKINDIAATQVAPDKSSVLLKVTLELRGNRVYYNPDISGEPGSISDIVDSWVDVAFNIASKIKLLNNKNDTFYTEISESQELEQLKNTIMQLKEVTIQKLMNLKSAYTKYSYLWEEDQKEFLKKFISGQLDELYELEDDFEDEEGRKGDQARLSLEEFELQIVKYEKLHEDIQELPETAHFGWITVDAQPLRQAISTIARKWRLMFLDYLSKDVENQLEEFDKFINDMTTGLQQDCPKDDYPKLVELMGYLLQIRERPDFKNEEKFFGPLRDTVALLRKYGITVSEEIIHKLETGVDKWKGLSKLYFDVKDKLAVLQNAEIKKISKYETTFNEQAEQYRKEFLEKAPFAFSVGPSRAYEIIDELNKELEEREEALRDLRAKQKLFGLIQNQGVTIKNNRADLKLLKTVWDYVDMVLWQIEDWKKLPFLEINTDDMEEVSNKFQKAIKKINNKARMWDVYNGLDVVVSNFLTTLPLIQKLRNEGMRPRHWNQLMEQTGVKFELSKNFKLADLMALNLHNFTEQVNEIVDRATKEMQMEKQFKELAKIWNGLSFEFEEYKDVHLVKIPEDAIVYLEDNTTQLQNISSNRFIDYFLDDLNEWQKKLGNVDTIGNLYMDVQKTWQYLENIFIGSEDIREQLPEDTLRFDRIDVELKKIMKLAYEKQNIVEFCSQPDLEETLTSLQEQLGICENHLSDYLETKKKAFPRFYFISVNDLLDILSKGGQNPHAIMQHMSKLFQAIDYLEFEVDKDGNKTNKAIAMVSREGERVPLLTPCLCEGKVEDWFNNFLQCMRETLRDILAKAIAAYAEKPREEWLLQFPAQIVLIVSQLVYTSEVNHAFEALEENNENDMKEYHEKQKKQLNGLIMMVQKDLTKEVRQKVMNLVTIEVHSRDIVQRLIDENITSAQSFVWQSQLRQTWIESTKDVRIDICDASFLYGYEYLGNAPRLVITPLTDRIYITLTQSLHLIMGGAPAGPAGTGKTETTKDLGSQLGKTVYVFNCSDQMDHNSLGNIFKGLASSGSWGCFDEFNRIAVEVLSVVSTQFKSILDAIKEKKEKFMFVSDEIKLDPTVGVFITMNPGYLGRTELPESLKALFRPVTVVVPDLELICENMLMAEGFINARVLAKKFITLYSLNRDLLSKQDHYDWGLRAIKSVLVVAGSLKRAEPEIPEDHILMRALRDFNLPKIIADDVDVFLGLIEDLFPGIDLPRKVDKEFEKIIATVIQECGWQPEENLILKVVQLSEVMEVRHSIFIIGAAGCGKSTCWKSLAQALRKKNIRVTVRDIDPKAITNNELYGRFHEQTGEWKDGLVSKQMRDLANEPDKNPKWIVLDGDLDTEWIESMNSVMDDNKVLTLANNDRIPLLGHMRLIFEISHLKYATPATVSRAGIIYIGERDIGWNPYVTSWIDKRPQAERAQLVILFDRYVPDTLKFLADECKTIIPISDFNMVCNLCCLLDGLLTPENVGNSSEKDIFEQYFTFAVIWALGGALATNREYKKHFDKWFKKQFKKTHKFPEADTVFDYYLNPVSKKFEKWSDLVKEYVHSEDRDLPSIMVPTVETEYLSYFMNQLIELKKPVMLVGNAGCGKTQLVKQILENLPEEKIISTTINFNYYTDSQTLQNTMEMSLEKKGGRRYGPPGSKRMIFFIDDLNMPALDAYQTQTPIALMRQHVDYGHWYDRGKWTLKEILNVQYVACMNPTAGSFTINSRLQRHFFTLSVSFPERPSLVRIYSSIFGAHVKKFSYEIQNISQTLIDAVLDLHEKVSQKFQKTAVFFHYEFNLRHLSNIFEGFLRSEPKVFKNVLKFVRLWIHESYRVYADRLATTEHIAQFTDLIKQVSKARFPDIQTDDIFKEPIIFTSFTDGFDSQNKYYNEFESEEKLREMLQMALEEHNSSRTVMDLVLFKDAMHHVCRITRILESALGNALLVGVGGSGKQSLAKLAAFICDYEVYQITITRTYGVNDLKEDLRIMYRRAGLRGRATMFLFTDTQIVNMKFLVYINDLLSSGNITDLFSDEDKEEIAAQIKSKAKQAGIIDANKENCWKFFIEQVRKYLHVVLCFSPVGDNLRIYSRKFPALINCTVIDWFFPWPEEALLQVANRFLTDENLGEHHDSIVKFMAYAHEAVNRISEKYRIEERRYTYTTPKSYLELIKLYKTMLAKKREEINKNIKRLQSGIEKLKATNEDVAKLEEVLKKQQVEVNLKKQECDKLLEEVAKEKQIVAGENAKALAEEQKVEKLTQAVAAQRAECEEDLKQAEPAVLKAQAALDTLDQKELTEMRSFKKPPKEVAEVMAAVMCLLSPKPLRPADKKWDKAQKVMAKGADAFLQTLKNYDKDNIPPASLKGAEDYIKRDFFRPDVISTKSKAAAGLCEWVINIVAYYKIYITVVPKREKLKAAEKQEAEANEKLRRVKAKVEKLKQKLDKITEEFNAAENEKLAIIARAQKTEESLRLAHRLLNALTSENERWNQEMKILKEKASVLVGDVLLAAAFVSYAGSFDIVYRKILLEEWMKFITENKIPISPNANPIDVLVDTATIAQWNNQLLPSDQTSIENGCILTNCERWPLMIDPQLQGITWIRRKFSENLQVLRLGQRGLIEKIERAIQNGWTVLIENIGEEIDAVLAPILGRKIFIRNKQKYIKLENEVEYDDNFKLIFHTKLSNPHYIPEIQAETTLINFSVTEKGLEDQLLALVVRREREDLEEKQATLRMQQNEFKIKLFTLENELLDVLSAADQETILSDAKLIENLEKTQETSIEIKQKVKQAIETEESIQKAREQYRPVARRGSLLYFALDQLKSIQNMYHFSLNAFVVVFNRAITNAETSDDVQVRVNNLIKTITITVFNYTNRGLFERHKLIFATDLCFKILRDIGDKDLDPEELEFLIYDKKDPSPGENIFADWLSAESWAGLQALRRLDKFSKLVDDIAGSTKRWLAWCMNEAPEKEKMPQDWKNASEFHKLLIIKVLRPDRITHAVAKFVREKLGDEFINPPPFSMDQVFAESKPSTPLFFILFPGADPIKEIESFGKKLGFAEENNKFVNISLGKGQEQRAEEALNKCYENGGWVVLQNIHLMQKWLPTLERRLEILSEGSHKDFRVFLTAEPSEHQIPQSILQASIKITNEPPQNLKANLLRAWSNFNQETLDSSSKPNEFRSILFSLCFFHSLVLGRRKFGFQGWSRYYSFNMGDLTISADVLYNYLEINDKVPWEDIRYIFGEIMYGGHITDNWDRRVCSTYLKCLMKDELFDEIELAPNFHAPPAFQRFEEFVEYIETSLPDESPLMFGLHPNAEINFLTSEAETLFNTLIDLRGGTTSHTSMSKEERVSIRLQDLLNALPNDFNIRELNSRMEKKPPYVSVAIQECERMNILLGEIRRSSRELALGLKGELTISEQMDILLNSIYLERVPDTWAKVAYPSLKSLTFWFDDLLKRYAQLEEWTTDYILPKSVWISGLFNPMSFITAIIQTTARKSQSPLDQMCIQTEVSKKTKDEITAMPREGCYIHGLFLEGAGWDIKQGCLRESVLKELHTPMPVIHIKAVTLDKRDTKNIYECPVYITSQRGPTYVFTAQLKTRNDPSHWTLRGVALLLQS